ncbi:NF-kappa-B inhibitor zeta I-kappa-B-zeta [Larimichthys crocea]|uniref:NF-kappa-B inhibitor zeta I-kappa-B-zeta n=1 Tax=Larimichthys crocea TaxID=215358 RepID=A0A6G0HGW4_LARCR|nr:NF-kappa-B inhibitor zeta I-kappa-B-zeta [Larimichthys crocea]
MLDPRGNETRGSMSAGTDFINDTVIDNRPAEYFQTIHKKNTVKELLMMRRQKCSDNILEHKFKSPKSEVFPSDLSPHLFDPRHQYTSRETQRMEGVSQEKLNMQDGDGDTILHIAVAKGRRALAYVLATQMSRCGSLDVKEHNGQTALQIAAATNQHLIVHDLLEHGAQINTRDLWGRSPLHVCAEKGHLLSLQSIWKTLMRTGQPIDIEMFNYEGLTALHAAVMSHNAVVKELRTLENPCSYMTMELGQRRQMHFECIKILLHMGACFGTKDLKSGHTCLHMASEEANVELLNLFLDQSSSLSFINVKTFSGNTALHIVSSLQNHKTQVEAVRLLMRNGADPGTRNFENELPCHLVPGGPVGDKVRRVLKGKYVHA